MPAPDLPAGDGVEPLVDDCVEPPRRCVTYPCIPVERSVDASVRPVEAIHPFASLTTGVNRSRGRPRPAEARIG